MTIVDPTSESEVLRSSVILLIRVDQIQPGPEEPEPGGQLLVSRVTLQLVIEEVLQGEVRQKPDLPFEFMAIRRRTMSGRVMDNYGLWSMVELTVGARFIAFCRDDSDDATVLLTEDHCEQLVKAEDALDDVKTALNLEGQEAALSVVLAEAANKSDQLADIFARYVAAKAKRQEMPALANVRAPQPTEELMTPSTSADFVSGGGDAFEAVMTILEDPKTTDSARMVYLTSIYDDLTMMHTPPRQSVMRLIRALFKLLTMPEAEALHESISQVYLPNLLGTGNPAPAYAPAEIFQNQEGTRVDALAALKQAPPNAAISPIIRWLESV